MCDNGVCVYFLVVIHSHTGANYRESPNNTGCVSQTQTVFLDKLLSIFVLHIIVLQGLPHILYTGTHILYTATYVPTYIGRYLHM